MSEFDFSGHECPPIYRDIQVYLINLNRSADRLAKVTEQLNRRKVPFERVSAFDANAEDLNLCKIDRPHFKRVHGRTLIRNAEIGCHQSHMQALTRFVDSDKKFAVIFEDDIEIAEEFDPVLHQLLVWKDDWDIVPLFHWHRGTPIRIKHEGNLSLNIFLTSVTSSAAYVVSRQAAMVLLTHMAVQKACVDHELFDIASHHLRLRGVMPRTITLSDEANVSTIGASGNGSSVKPAIWKRLPTLAYRSRYAIYRLFKGAVDALVR
jgi:glycosyl transferase, family 25